MYLLDLRTTLFILAGAVIIGFSSCVPHRELVSLNAGETVLSSNETDRSSRIVDTPPFEPYKIRPNDQLMIRVNAFEGSTEEFINREFTPGDNNVRIDFDPASVHFNSYVVSDAGYIKLPILDSVYVVGRTVAEVKSMLDSDYQPYLKLASSNVKLANRRVTILGEIGNPGVHYLYNDQNTLLDAIALAGDFTSFGNRKKVRVIRRTDNGSRTVYLDLNKSDFMTSEYYYVEPHDIVYIEPLKAKAFDVSARSVGVVISAVSLGAIIANLFIR